MQFLRGRAPSIALALTTLVFAAWALATARWPAATLAAALHDHDASYYLNIAWNIGTTGHASFDGLHPTSGFHLAWAALLSLLAMLARDKDQLVVLAHVLGAAINLCTAALLFRIGRGLDPEKRHRALAPLLAMSWMCWAMTRSSHLMGGMETALLALGYALLLHALLGVDRAWQAGRADSRAEWFCGIGAALIAFARIDNALVSSLALLAFYLLHPARPPLRARLLLAGAMPVAALAISAAIYHQLAGEWLPVSGIAKLMARRELRLSAGLPLFAKAFAPFDALHQARVLLSLLYLGALATAHRWLLPRWSGRGGLAVTAVAAAFVPYIALLCFWHKGILVVYVAGLYLVWLLAAAMGGVTLRPRLGALPLGVLASILLAAAAAMVAASRLHAAPEKSYASERVRFAQAISTQWPAHCRLASFNSGQLGYFMTQPMINLDGFVNSGDYLRTVYLHPERLDEYLQRERVSYLIDYDFYWADALLKNYQQLDGAPLGLRRLRLYRTPYAEADCPN